MSLYNIDFSNNPDPIIKFVNQNNSARKKSDSHLRQHACLPIIEKAYLMILFHSNKDLNLIDCGRCLFISLQRLHHLHLLDWQQGTDSCHRQLKQRGRALGRQPSDARQKHEVAHVAGGIAVVESACAHQRFAHGRNPPP